MSNNVLGAVVTSFITDITDALDSATAGLAQVDRERFRTDVAVEAFNLTVAMIDSDDRHTVDELEALIDAFAELLPDTQLLMATPQTLQNSSIVVGTKGWMSTDSELFTLLVEADTRSGTELAQRYYDRALDLAHVVASLDVVTSQAELTAISALRGRLLAGIARAGGDSGSRRCTQDTDLDSENSDPSRSRTDSRANSPADSSTESAVAVTSPPVESASPARPIEELLAELDELIGLDEVKARVRMVTDFLYIQRLRVDRGLPSMDTSHHLVFTGNPGTGKTTVARLLAQIYRTLGVVARGQLVEADRSGLVAGFVGQTAPLVTRRFDDADGGILFIDEAYTLARGNENDFGREAIDQIVKLMEDRRDRVVLIVAGYPSEMEQFISANPGLRSRFPTTIEFPDYTTEELMRIVDSIGSKSRYLLTDEARIRFIEVLDQIPRTKGFGNARVARNMFESAVAHQASRLVKQGAEGEAALTTLEPEDIVEASDPSNKGELDDGLLDAELSS
ncbi:MAG TPA: AAA family ATPase [Microthrixaceae bacterium]|nr:AAA family ATPase [Microthrixaceae bacterium]